MRIRIGGHEYGSWDEVPEELRAQLIAAGVDPGPDGRIDTADLWRAGGPVVQHTEVTGPGGRPLPPVLGDALASVFDALNPPPLRPGPLTHGCAQPSTVTDGSGDVDRTPAGRPPLLVWGIALAAGVMFVATLLAILGR